LQNSKSFTPICKSSAIIYSMPIIFSEHALSQLERRRISAKRAVEVVEDPNEIIKSYKNRRLRRKVYSDKILQIVTVTEGSKITIVSGYYLRR
jgi:hypothetical protein